jgi:hypothetical protein
MQRRKVTLRPKQMIIVTLLLFFCVTGLTIGKDVTKLDVSQDRGRISCSYYIVYKNDSGKIFAKSGITGKQIAGSTDASEVIQSAIDKLPVTGGKVYISAGSYELTKTIKIKNKHGVHLEGAARGIIFSGGHEGTSLRSSKAIDLIHIHGGKLKIAGVLVSNMHLIGSGKNNGKAGILVTGNSDLLSLHQVGANNCGIGFYLKGGGPGEGVIDAPQIQFCDPQVNGIGLKIERVHYAKVVGGEFSDCDEYGIMLSSLIGGHHKAQGHKILGVTGVRNGKAGILIGANTECITVSGGADFGGVRNGSGIVVTDEGTGAFPKNIIISGIHSYNNSFAGISVENSNHVIIQGCIFSTHTHAAVDNEGQKHGIYIKDNCYNIVEQGNISYGSEKQGIVNKSKSETDK